MGRRAGVAEAIFGLILGLSAMLAGATGCNSAQKQSAAPTCQDDRPPDGGVFVQGGTQCTLLDGGAGVGKGKYGCVDPNACHCKPQAGSATCDPGGVCVYSACSGANQGQTCALADGKRGSCCKGACVADLENDPSNCGICGNVCTSGASCSGGACVLPDGGTTLECTQGLVEVPGSCGGSTCLVCVALSCAGIPDGAPCAVDANTQGLCCQGTCVGWYGDDRNCGGCGVTCCTGAHCATGDSFGLSGLCI